MDMPLEENVRKENTFQKSQDYGKKPRTKTESI